MPCTVSRSRPWAAVISIALFSECALSASVSIVGISPHGTIEGEPRRLLRKESKDSEDVTPVVSSAASNATAAAAVSSAPTSSPTGNATVEEDVEGAESEGVDHNATVTDTSKNATVSAVTAAPVAAPLVPAFTPVGENSSVEIHPPATPSNSTDGGQSKRPMDIMCEAVGNATVGTPNGALAVCPADFDCMKWMLDTHGDNYTMKNHRATCCCVPKADAKPGEECYVCGCMKSCNHGCPYDSDVEECRR